MAGTENGGDTRSGQSPGHLLRDVLLGSCSEKDSLCWSSPLIAAGLRPVPWAPQGQGQGPSCLWVSQQSFVCPSCSGSVEDTQASGQLAAWVQIGTVICWLVLMTTGLPLGSALCQACVALLSDSNLMPLSVMQLEEVLCYTGTTLRVSSGRLPCPSQTTRFRSGSPSSSLCGLRQAAPLSGPWCPNSPMEAGTPGSWVLCSGKAGASLKPWRGQELGGGAGCRQVRHTDPGGLTRLSEGSGPGSLPRGAHGEALGAGTVLGAGTLYPPGLG